LEHLKVQHLQDTNINFTQYNLFYSLNNNNNIIFIIKIVFWSAVTQRKTRNEVLRPFTSYDSLATHAMQWIAGAKYLSPPIDPIDSVSTIIQHYPIPLSMAHRGRGPRSKNNIVGCVD